MARITSLSGDGGEAPAQSFSPFTATAVSDLGDDSEAEQPESPEDSEETPEAEATDADSDESAVEEPDAEAASDEPDDEEDDDDAEGAEAEQQPAPEPEVGEPVRFTVGRQTYDLPGAAIYSNGWVGVSPEGVPEFRRLVELGRWQETVGRHEYARVQNELKAARATVNEDGVKGKAIWDRLIHLATDPVGQDGKDAQTRMWEFCANLNETWPKLVLDAERQINQAYYQQALALRQEDPQEVQAREWQEFEGRSDMTIWDLVQRVGRDPRFDALSDREIEAFADRLDRTKGLVYQRAPDDIPGVARKGEWVMNEPYVLNELNAALALAQQRETVGQRQREAKQHNQRRLAQPNRRPSAGGGQREAQGSSEPRTKFKNREDYERYMRAQMDGLIAATQSG